MRGRNSAWWRTIPMVTVKTNRPRLAKVPVTSRVPAMEAAIRLDIPTGVILSELNIQDMNYHCYTVQLLKDWTCVKSCVFKQITNMYRMNSHCRCPYQRNHRSTCNTTSVLTAKKSRNGLAFFPIFPAAVPKNIQATIRPSNN